MSTLAASAAQASRNDAATTAVPNRASPTGAGVSSPVNRTTSAGRVNRTQIAIGRIGGTGIGGLPGRLAAVAGPAGRTPARTARLTEGLVHPLVRGPCRRGIAGSPACRRTGRSDYSPSGMATLTYVSSITQVTKPPGGSARPWPTAGAMGKTGPMVRPSGSAADPAPSSLPGEPTQPQLCSAAATFALLSSPTRLHLAWLMAHETYGVGDLAVRVGLSIATTSQHLGKLRLAGVVSARRQGRHTYYTIDDPHVLALIEQIFSHIAPDGTLAPDPPS